MTQVSGYLPHAQETLVEFKLLALAWSKVVGVWEVNKHMEKNLSISLSLSFPLSIPSSVYSPHPLNVCISHSSCPCFYGKLIKYLIIVFFYSYKIKRQFVIRLRNNLWQTLWMQTIAILQNMSVHHLPNPGLKSRFVRNWNVIHKGSWDCLSVSHPNNSITMTMNRWCRAETPF